jgi:hypothetical protein
MPSQYDDEYKKALDQIYQIQTGTDNMIPSGPKIPPYPPQIPPYPPQIPPYPPGTAVGMSGSTAPGRFTPPCAMVTDMPYFVLWYDTLSCIYVGTWCADDEAAIAEAQAIQNDKTKHCGQVLIMERDQQWLKTWERR